MYLCIINSFNFKLCTQCSIITALEYYLIMNAVIVLDNYPILSLVMFNILRWLYWDIKQFKWLLDLWMGVNEDKQERGTSWWNSWTLHSSRQEIFFSFKHQCNCWVLSIAALHLILYARTQTVSTWIRTFLNLLCSPKLNVVKISWIQSCDNPTCCYEL